MTQITDYTTHSLFEEPYWLDATAPNAWSAVEIKAEGKLIGRLPYVIKKKFGIKALTIPHYTPWLGPWVNSSGKTGAKALSQQHQIVEQLVRGLPKTHLSLIPSAPEFTNLQGFGWAGYTLNFGYTYRLYELENEKKLWSSIRDSTRRQCRKAEKQVEISTNEDIHTLISILEKTFSRQNIDMSVTFPTLERIDDVMRARKQRTLYVARDEKNQVHGAVYTVHDARHTFYIAGGGDPAWRQSGAQSLAMWHAIKSAHMQSEVFDFMGSMVQPIERFVRNYGAEQTLRLSAVRKSHFGHAVNFVRSLRR